MLFLRVVVEELCKAVEASVCRRVIPGETYKRRMANLTKDNKYDLIMHYKQSMHLLENSQQEFSTKKYRGNEMDSNKSIWNARKQNNERYICIVIIFPLSL